MCRPASMVLTETEVHWRGESDSHEAIIKHAGLKDDKLPPDFVRVEITPPGGDLSRPLERWVYRVDQDVMPTWYNARREEARTRNALHEWFAACVMASGEHETVGRDTRYLCGTVVVGEMYGSAQVREMCGSAQVREMYGSAQVREMCGSAQVGAMRDSAQVRVMCGSAQVGAMRDSAQVRVMCGSAQVGAMYGSAQVGAMRDSAQVGEMGGRSTASRYDRSARVGDAGGDAVLIDRSATPPVCYVGLAIVAMMKEER